MDTVHHTGMVTTTRHETSIWSTPRKHLLTLHDHVLRVGLVTAEYPGYTQVGGIGTYVGAAATGLLELGHQPFVLLCNHFRLRCEAPGDIPVIPVYPDGWASRLPFPFGRGASIMLGRRLRALAKEMRLDILEAPEFGGLTGFLPVTRSDPFRVVVRLHMGSSLVNSANHANPVSRKQVLTTALVEWTEKRAITNAHAVTSISKVTTTETLNAYSLVRNDIVTIPNPVRPDFFDAPMQTHTRDASDPVVLFVGRLEWRKGPDLLVQAFPQILRRFPKARLLLVGSDTRTAPGNGSMLKYLSSLVARDAFSSIEFLGCRAPEELPQIYRRADVCVFPSRWEGFGIVCAEAMACGKPVILPRESGFAEHIIDNRNGLLLDSNGPTSIANRVVEVLSNVTLRRSVGLAARCYALQRFHPNSVGNLLSQFYQEVVSSRGSET